MKKRFDRKFVFDSPVDLFPNLVARLAGNPGRAGDFIRGVPAPIVSRRGRF